MLRSAPFSTAASFYKEHQQMFHEALESFKFIRRCNNAASGGEGAKYGFNLLTRENITLDQKRNV